MADNPLGYFSLQELGAAIRAERKALGRTQEWVAQNTKCRRQTIIDLENGKNVELLTLMTVLAALDKGLRIVDRRISLDEINELFKDDG